MLILRLEGRREVVLVSRWLSPRLPLLLTKLVRKAFCEGLLSTLTSLLESLSPRVEGLMMRIVVVELGGELA